MRKIIHTFLALLLSGSIYAQAPQNFKYQAIARDASGQVFDNKDVSFQISILEGSTTGTSVYTETFTATTNQFGLVNLNIGSGNSSDDFTAINWSSTTFFVQIMMDPTGLSDYQLMGTSQMLSVPYALHAKTAENTFSGDYNDLSNTPDLSNYDTDVTDDYNGDYNNLTNTPDLSNYITEETDPVYSGWDKSTGISITESQISNFGNYESAFTKNSAFNNNFGNVAGTVTEGNDSRLSDARTPTSHAASHINGTDDIQDATSSQKGLMTATYATKLDGVETNADVTNATNVDAAGAVMKSDFNAGTFLYATSDDTPQPKNISETKTILSLENVENTALSTWEGSGNIASLGTVTSGTLSTGSTLADVTMSLGSDADGDIYYRSGSKLTRLPKGTDDQVLTLESGLPAWKDAASGGGSLSIGDFYGGGIIFWLDASGNHGLICAIEDQSTGIIWHEDASGLVTGATLDATYGGAANTNIIVSHAGASNAAQLCDEYSVTVNNEYYDNWYLPSHYELVLMYNNKATINTTIASNSGSALTGDTYWSSTELNFQSAETVYFTNGGEGYVTKTVTSISARAIRAF